MNKLDCSNLGGDPFTLDDLDFLQKALTEGINGLSSILNNTLIKACILSGINLTETTPNNWQWVDGYVWINGEIYKVSAGTCVTPTTPSQTVPCWSIVAGFDSNGTVQFENLSTYPTYIVRTATIIASTPALTLPGNPFVPTANKTPTFVGALSLLTDKSLPWKYVNTPGQPTFNSTWANATTGGAAPDHCRFRINEIGEVEISGDVTIVSFSPGASTIFALPSSDYFPAALKSFILAGDDGSGNSFLYCTVSVGGAIQVYGASGVPKTVCLNMKYRRD